MIAPIPPNIAQVLANVADNLAPLREMAIGYREQLKRDGWSDTQAIVGDPSDWGKGVVIGYDIYAPAGTVASHVNQVVVRGDTQAEIVAADLLRHLNALSFGRVVPR